MFEYRRDGWPLCPVCGEDELASTRPIDTEPITDARGRIIGRRLVVDVSRPHATTDPMRCLRCGWAGTVPARVVS